jgi:hypothetical protein
VLCPLDGSCDRAALGRELGGALEGALAWLAANAFLMPQRFRKISPRAAAPL